MYYSKENTDPQKKLLQVCEEKKCVALGNVFKVKRGNGEAYDLFIEDCKAHAKIYAECYPFESDETGYNRLNLILWVRSKGSGNAAEKALNKPEIKEFIDSIEYW